MHKNADVPFSETGVPRVPPKVPVEGACPECGQEQLCQYPVLAAEGWFEVVKCQNCLAGVSRERWYRLGWVRLPEDDT